MKPKNYKHPRNPIKRNMRTIGISARGLRDAFFYDAGVMQWTVLCPILALLAVFLGDTWVETAVMIALVFTIYIVELINTAIEITLDLITRDENEQVRLAKDIMSGAVMAALIFAAIIWLILIIN